MASLGSYLFLTVNGLYKGPGEDISWHRHGAEEAKFSQESLGQGNVLVLGRRTYEMMASWWPTPAAAAAMPEVADGMNRSRKLVLTRKPFEPGWENTTVVTGDVVGEMRRRKAARGPDMTILGSGEIVSLLARHGLVDEFQFMIDPVAMPEGTRVFAGLQEKLDLRLVDSRVFESGVVLLTYRPTAISAEPQPAGRNEERKPNAPSSRKGSGGAR